MLTIGERINGMFRDVRRAIEEKDKKVIQDLAKKQLEHGADWLDLNTGPTENAKEAMLWLIDCINELGEINICIDSSKSEVIEAGLKHVGRPAFLNSVTAEVPKLERLLPLAKEYDSHIIALAMDEKGIPASVEERIELAAVVLAYGGELGIPQDRFWIDPLILPVNVSQTSPKTVLEAILMIKQLDNPALNTILGLSNVSQKCTERSLLNRTFLAMALAAGLDGAILDISDIELQNSMIASELLLNKDIYCDSFLSAYRKK